MTLVITEDLRGLWCRDEGEAGVIPFSSSSADIKVTDGAGMVMDGALVVNGRRFEVKRGKCKILTEALSRIGFSDVEFITVGGIKRPCAYVRHLGEKVWYFPSPREALSNDEIFALLRKLRCLREKLDSAKALCSDKVSGVLGI